jgi:hypothetical protein
MSARLPLIAEGSSRPLRWRSAFGHERRTTPGRFVQFPYNRDEIARRWAQPAA